MVNRGAWFWGTHVCLCHGARRYEGCLGIILEFWSQMTLDVVCLMLAVCLMVGKSDHHSSLLSSLCGRFFLLLETKAVHLVWDFNPY